MVFQPAEEGGAGAKKMIDDGVLESPHVDAIYGQHLWNYMPYGMVGATRGPMMAASDRWDIRVEGKGGHGAKRRVKVVVLPSRREAPRKGNGA